MMIDLFFWMEENIIVNNVSDDAGPRSNNAGLTRGFLAANNRH